MLTSPSVCFRLCPRLILKFENQILNCRICVFVCVFLLQYFFKTINKY